MFALYYLRNWLKCQRGQDIIEYALLVGFIALVAVLGIQAAGEGIDTMFRAIGDAISGIEFPL
jgi:Flp pilus assembly pilin Flp